MIHQDRRGSTRSTDFSLYRMRGSRAIILFSAVVLTVAAFQIASSAGRAQTTVKKSDAPVTVKFTDLRKQAGITFLQDSTQTEDKLYLETMGTGVGWLDYDQDGLMDLYFVQSGPTELYKPDHPMRSALYHNNGDGTFTDVTANAGVADEGGWSTSAAWLDYDHDGYLDLVVLNYIEWSAKNNLWCGEHRPGYRSYCHPGNYKGQHIKLYHNNHDGTFTDVSESSGIGKPEAKGMGVVAADFNNDGWTDVAVANDSWPNFLFINKHDGTFQDVSFVSGIAASEDGRYEAGMGIDAADLTGNGLQDIFITHLDFELNRLYTNNGDGSFTDATFSSGIGNKAILYSGVSMKFLDYDNDGWPDIVQLNGAMVDNVQLYHSEVTYKEPLLMFRNLGKGQFEKIPDGALGPDFSRPIAGRGIATADFDNNGTIDIAVNNRGDYPMLLRNDQPHDDAGNHWLEVLLIGTKSNRDGIGASLKLTAEGITHIEQAKGGMSYMSASDPRVHLGLGKRSKIDQLEITWPSGTIDRLKDLPIDKIIVVKEGAGIVPRNFPKVPSR